MKELILPSTRVKTFRYPEAHWLAFAAMALAIYPMFRLANLPLRIDLLGMGSAYWWGTTARALFIAIVLSVISLPASQTFLPVVARYRENLIRLIFLALLCGWLIFILGPAFGLLMLVNTVAAAELLDRDPQAIGRRVLDAVLPATYLFVGLLLVFSLNHAIAGLKYAGSWDGYFNHLDAAFFGRTVPQVAAWSRIHIPIGVWSVAAFAYYNVYGQIGGVLVIVALLEGRTTATRYAGTLLMAYALALICFYLMPTMGPFALHAMPSGGPEWLSGTHFSQKVLPIRAQLLWQHAAVPELYTVQIADYYIGFPSMHVAMPVIALWFCRKGKRLMWCLIAFDVLLTIGIVLLEWHYLLDIVGGVAVAAVAIVLCSPERQTSFVRHALAEA